MSWSMFANGTKEAAKRQLSGQSLWNGATEEERTVYAATKEQLCAMIDRAGPVYGENSVLIVKASASGHGTALSALTFGCESVDLK